MYILGISAFYHDAAAVLLNGPGILAAAQEERFTRIKHDPAFPVHAIRYCLEEAGITVDDLSYICFYDKPFLKFERLLETFTLNSPSGFANFLRAIPKWTGEKLFTKKKIADELRALNGDRKPRCPILFTEHHLSHAASSFFVSPFDDAAIIVADGVGEWATTTIASGSGNTITTLREQHFPHSIGLLYSAVTFYCGFRVNSGEYKLMGLAPYGTDEQEITRLEKVITETFCTLHPDGSVTLDQKWFTYATAMKMVNEKKWQLVIGFPARAPESSITADYCNLAAAMQRVLNRVMLNLATEAKRLTGSENLCMAGGVALNCVANSVVQQSGLFRNIYIQPAAGDAGGALGAALSAWYIHAGEKRVISSTDSMNGSLLGPAINTKEIVSLFNRYGARATESASPAEMSSKVAALVAEGSIVGFVQGRAEFGPRALGARSILGDPRDVTMQHRMNIAIKGRESFRPFAPAILEEYAADYFEMKHSSPYMLFTFPLRESIRTGVKQVNGDMFEIVNQQRSSIPAVTHVDYSARVQTVPPSATDPFRLVLEKFHLLTGVPLLINTSFNRRGEPIAGSATDAYFCFMASAMDYLVINNFIFDKKDQPVLQVPEGTRAFDPD